MNRVGIIGLPNAGKSTLFNFLCNTNVLTASYPFSTVSPNKASYRMYEYGASDLAKHTGASDILWSELELWDVAGLIENAHTGEGLGNEFLGQIRDTHSLIHVIGATKGADVNDLEKNLGIVNREIALFDHKLLLKPFEKTRRLRRLYPKEMDYVKRDNYLSRVYYGTRDGTWATEILNHEELADLQNVGLITTKPQLILINSRSPTKSIETMRIGKKHAEMVNVTDMATLRGLTPNECRILGYSENMVPYFLNNLTEQLLSLMNLKVFYTVGELGVGQWVIGKDASASECSRLLHQDLEAEIKSVRSCSYENYLKATSWNRAAKLGLSKKFSANYVPDHREVLYFERS